MASHEKSAISRPPSYVAATLPFEYLLARALSFIRSHPGAEAADAMAHLLCAIGDPDFHPLRIGRLRRLDTEARGLAMGLLDACLVGSTGGGLDRELLAQSTDVAIRSLDDVREAGPRWNSEHHCVGGSISEGLRGR